ncbi:queuosine precursor transporter [Sphingomonas morindae]|uniref:Probable queuosine precursor transporter n=1 Tax=Sphingomonas morindae TaxID=1541170 RepID=A0ABY4XB47_9SPHN|nr:queuosine precursor transporter [Sphingomonas morindae]USI74192.1 queuosine precursor transporter [Sphingomonas morindae]
MASSAPATALPRSLFFFALLYGGMVCMAGVLGNKLLALGPLAVEGGIFAFLILVVTSSAVAELHGAAMANRLVRWGFVPMLVAIALIQLILALPAAGAMEPSRLAAFHTILAQGARLMFAGLIAYGTSQTLNVTLFSALKGREGGRLLWLRAGIASIASQVVDTFLFVTIAFYGVFPITGIIIGQMIAKVVLSAVLVPPAVYAMVALGRRLDAGIPVG